jgi:hypothetical protein
MKDEIYKCVKKIDQTNKDVLDIFAKLVVIDEEGESIIVPAIWANLEKAKAQLPVIGIFSTHLSLDDATPVIFYTGNILTLYEEDMNQIIEQIISKFDNKKNCKLLDIHRVETRDGDKKFNHWSFCISVIGIGVPVETQVRLT